MNATPSTITKKILLVEDDNNIRDLYADLLKSEGYQVEVATDGQLAFNLLSQGGYDLVFLDIILPKMDGINILEKLKNQPPDKPNGPVILLSNLIQDSVVQKGLDLGAIESLTKSNITPDVITQKAKQYLS